MTNLVKAHWGSLVFFILLIVCVQLMGATVTFPNIPTWYVALKQPPWTPPNWLFGPVWTVLYIILAIAGWRMWIGLPGRVIERLKNPIIAFYFAQLFCNAIWSPLFFGYHLTEVALSDLILTILFTALLIFQVSRINRLVAYALLPYFLWLCYAASLNGAIVVLN